MLNVMKFMVAALAAITISWTTAEIAQSADGVCTAAINGGQYENLEVPANASCTLNGTRVDGNIFVRNNATLRATGVSVGGSIQAEGAADVTVNNSTTVGGSVQVKQGGSATLDQVRVTGDIQVESNRSALSVTRNTVGGNVQVFQNRGGATITDNRIDGNLQCKENVPAPVGGRNQAASFEDQCAGFAGAPVPPTPTATPTPVTPTPTATPVTPAPTATPTPGGSDGVCRGAINGGQYENLEVPANASCTLNGTRVDGNLFVRNNATLHAVGVSVGGNIQAEGAADVTVNNISTVGGSVQVKQGGSATVDQVRVTGDIQVEANRSALSVTRNTVGGNVQVFQNTGGAAITDNRIDGNLQCKENVPAPVGGRNQAASFEDQCAGFAGEPVIVSPTPAPGSDSVQCQGSIGAQSYVNIVVPAGAACSLLGTRVTGNVTVGAGATLQASGLNVTGNIQGQGAAVVTINNNSTVGGSVQLKDGGSATVDQVQIAGNLRLEANTRALIATRNRVGGDLQAVGNQAGIVVRSNMVDGALQCQQNTLLPQADANQAASLEAQCAELSVRVYLPAISAAQ